MSIPFTKPIRIPAGIPIVHHTKDERGTVHVHCAQYDRDTILISFAQLELMAKVVDQLHSLAHDANKKKSALADKVLRDHLVALSIDHGTPADTYTPDPYAYETEARQKSKAKRK